MIDNLSPRDKRVLTFGGIFLLFYLLFVFAVQPVLKRHQRAEKQIENKILFIHKYNQVLNQKSFYEEKNKANQSIQGTLERRYLNEDKPGLAAASLQKILEGIAKRSAITIERVGVKKPKTIEGLEAVPVEITLRSSLRNLSQFIHQVENDSRFLVIEEMVARRINKTDPEELQTRLLVSGFIRQTREATGKKI